jgi:formyltetrahydrofolate deformylase
MWKSFDYINHMDLKPSLINSIFRFPCSFTKDNKESGESNKSNYEKYEINFIVLARYMQIITPI